MADEKRCGLCRHWKPFQGTKQVGTCTFPVPSSVTRMDDYMSAIDGTDCPCFERKEASDD